MKKFFKIFGITLIALILLRGQIFRATVKYSANEQREIRKITDTTLIQLIETKIQGENPSIESIINVSRSISKETLNFTFKKASSDPNLIYHQERANCVGYSSMFSSIADYLIKRYGLQDRFEVDHLVGHLRFLGINLHKFINNPFFRDHDFNSIKDLRTGEAIYIDPSIYDFLRIKKVSIRK